MADSSALLSVLSGYDLPTGNRICDGSVLIGKRNVIAFFRPLPWDYEGRGQMNSSRRNGSGQARQMTTVHINATTETINVALKGHQIALEDWDFQSFSADLHAWAERIILDFKFEIGIPALKIEPLRRRYGHYMRGRNGFGLIDEVAIDKCHVQDSSYWRVIGTLCHELIHAWQEHNATPPSPKSHNYHNREFREKAESIGLIVNQSGFTQYTPGDTPFFRLLKKCGMTVPELPQLQPAQPRPSRSTLQLYECPCGVKVRVGRSRFNARCLDCGGVFKKNL